MFVYRIQTGSGADLATYPMGTGGEAAGREGDHSPPSSAEAKNAWSYTSTPQHVFMSLCLIKHWILVYGAVQGVKLGLTY